MNKRICSGLIGLSLWSISPLAIGQEPLFFSSVNNSLTAQFSAEVLRQAYRQIDIEISHLPMNADQGLESANAGEVDGVLARIHGIEDLYPNLVQVPIPINFLELGVFSLQPDLKIEDWHDLAPYKVGIIKGMLLAERNSENLDIKRVDGYASVVNALLAGEIDVAVMPRNTAQVAIKQSGAKGIVDLCVVLENTLLYHYLHRRHQDLVPQIESILKTMLLDGTIQHLRSDTASTPSQVDFDFD